MSRVILHVDMDAFYAAVEQRDRPALRGKPVIIGADPKGGKGRGIVSTCSYEARKFGIHSAQPISQAFRLCPHGAYLRPEMEKYESVSRRVMSILGDFTDLVEPLSIDEAFLDVTGSHRLFGSGEEIARSIKARIVADQQLTASVGVAANKFVAKVASDLRKPDGLVVVASGTEREFLAPLPIGRLWGVGRKTEEVLRGLGLETIGQLTACDRSKLRGLFGVGGEHLWDLARGIDDRPVVTGEDAKSIGHERTFEKDTGDRDLLRSTLLDLTAKAAQRLRTHSVRARTVVVKLREADFTTHTRRVTVREPVDTAERMFPIAWRLTEDLLRPGALIRLIGVYGTQFEETAAAQLQLFDGGSVRNRRLASALDDITRRFGDRAITRAALVRKKDGSAP